jgi:hypothetical protein
MVFFRAFVVWLILLVVESAHGIARRLIVEPLVGDFSARQIAVFSGSALILMVTYVFIDWIAAKNTLQLTIAGVLWVLLTLAFEIGVGRFVLDYSWGRVLSDFNIAEGGLLGAGLLIMGLAPRITASLRRVRASKAERLCPLPGDDRIPQPAGSQTHAITVRCSPSGVWPWLAQMGAGRAGWYSYDFLDNGGRKSADRLLPEFQNVSVGTLFPGLPGAVDGFFVLDSERGHFLVLGANAQDKQQTATWSFVLQENGAGQTRLITRARVNAGYGFHGLPLGIVKLIHCIMQRKQLLEIARRAETEAPGCAGAKAVQAGQ